jgi:hypothetical protein
MDKIYKCECNVETCHNFVPTDEFEYLKGCEENDGDNHISLKGHYGDDSLVLKETEHLVLRRYKTEEDYELEEKISSLDTDQEIGNRE